MAHDYYNTAKQRPHPNSRVAWPFVVTSAATTTPKPGSASWPKNRFVEYDERDRPWLDGLGVIPKGEPSVFLMDGRPQMWAG